MSEATKRCPFCAEEILEAAKKCKHCGSDLNNMSAAETKTDKPAADYGLILLIIPVASTLLIWFWVSGMNLLQSPGTTLDFITVATVLTTAIVAALEASKVGMKSDRKRGFVADAGSCKCLIIGGYGWTRTTDLSIMSAAL